MKHLKDVFQKNRAKADEPTDSVKDAMEVLLSTPGLWRMSEDERVAMSISCRDTDYIPKVPGAGSVKRINGTRVQVLHNGLIVEADGYVGEWMTNIIKSLKGHHEPQEEKVFNEVIKRVKSGGTIIELGSYWSYYSLWFKKNVKNANAICIEPDPQNRALGVRNAALNNIEGITFLEGAAGENHNQRVPVELDSTPGQFIEVPILSVDGLMDEYNINSLDILHMDVQGFELDALKGALKNIKGGKIRFVFVSTHHYLFSRSPVTHQLCLQLIKENGGHVIASHTIPESFSGDGLIVASFSEEDKDFKVDMSLNHTDESLFRPFEEDLNILVEYYKKESS